MSKSILNIYYRETLDKIDSYEEYLSSMNITLDTKLWKQSLLAHTKEDYDHYLYHFSSGIYKKKALEAIDRIYEERAWKERKEEDTQVGYEHFLEVYSNGIYADEAQRKIDNFISLEKKKKAKIGEDIEWEKIEIENSLDGYLNYLEKYPQGYYVDIAKERLKVFLKDEEENDWNNIRNYKDNIIGYRNFIKTYPHSKFVDQAQYYIDEFIYDSSSIKSLEKFIIRNPRSHLIEKAKFTQKIYFVAMNLAVIHITLFVFSILLSNFISEGSSGAILFIMMGITCIVLPFIPLDKYRKMYFKKK